MQKFYSDLSTETVNEPAAAAVAHLASQGAAFGAAADPVAALHSSAALARGPVKGTPAADSPSPEGVAAEAAAAEVKVVVELLQLVVLSGFDFGSKHASLHPAIAGDVAVLTCVGCGSGGTDARYDAVEFVLVLFTFEAEHGGLWNDG